MANGNNNIPSFPMTEGEFRNLVNSHDFEAFNNIGQKDGVGFFYDCACRGWWDKFYRKNRTDDSRLKIRAMNELMKKDKELARTIDARAKEMVKK